MVLLQIGTADVSSFFCLFKKKKVIFCFSGLGSSVVSKPCSVTVANEVNKKKVDVIDLTIESSSDEEEDPPAKRKCIFMSETQGSPTKGFVNFEVSCYSVMCQIN